jgi:hypothetical protein
MTLQEPDREPHQSRRQDGGPLAKRGMAWALLVALLIATLLAAIVLAYLITKRNFPVA